MKLGDIYSWSWNEETASQMTTSFSAGTAYWCMDRYCVCVENKKGEVILVDTYHYNDYVSDELFTYESVRDQYVKVVDPHKVDLTLLGNINDYEEVSDWKLKDYKQSDILVVPCHAGYRKVNLKKKESKPDKEVMITNLEQNIERWTSDIRCMKNNIENAYKHIAELENN